MCIRSPLLPFTTISQQKLAERKGNIKSRGSIKISHEIKISPQVPPRWTLQQFQWVLYCLDGRDMWYNCLNNMMSQQSRVQNFPIWEKQKSDHKLYFSHWTKNKNTHSTRYIVKVHVNFDMNLHFSSRYLQCTKNISHKVWIFHRC